MRIRNYVVGPFTTHLCFCLVLPSYTSSLDVCYKVNTNSDGDINALIYDVRDKAGLLVYD